MSIEKARIYLQKAREIKAGSISFLKPHIEETRQELAALKGNEDLTEKGKTKKAAQIRSQRGIQLLKEIHTRKEEYTAYLQKAIKYADRRVYKPLPKPDATKLERFEADLRTLKTQLALSPHTGRAYEKLEAFVRKIDEPYMANIVRDDFDNIAGSLISSDDMGTKVKLSGMFEGLKTNFEDPEVTEARDILESATEAAEKPVLFNRGLAFDAAGEFTYNPADLDPDSKSAEKPVRNVSLGKYLNDTESYFAEHEDQRPEPWVDPEKEAEERADENREYLQDVKAAAEAKLEAELARLKVESLERQIARSEGQRPPKDEEAE